MNKKGLRYFGIRLMLIELGAIAAYALAGFLAYYAQIYRSLPIAHYLSFQVAQIIFIFGIQTILVSILFLQWRHYSRVPERPALAELMVLPEDEQLEFKSTLRWDLKTAKVNRVLEKAALKTVAAFLNSKGGTLVIGIDDARNPVGLHHDYATIQRTDADGFESHFSQIFASAIGPEFRQHVHLDHHTIGEKECCVVSVAPSRKPVYFRSDGSEEFFIRTGNGTTSLKLSEVASYVDSRFA